MRRPGSRTRRARGRRVADAAPRVEYPPRPRPPVQEYHAPFEWVRLPSRDYPRKPARQRSGGSLRLPVFSFLPAATCAFAAAAQTDDSAHSFSLQDDGVSLQGNPGGLAFVRGLELDVLNHGYFDDRQGDSYALLFTGGAGPLSLGAGWDFWRSQTAVSLGGALRLGELGLGAVHRWFYLVDGTRVSSWDFGALWRPFSFLSLGAAALQANRPSSQPRSWQLSVGVRPLEDLIELAGDFRYMECAYSAPPCGLDSGNVLLTGKVNIV